MEDCRAHAPEAIARVVVGVDPPASASGDACGIVVAGLAGGIGYVLADCSVAGLSPKGWARAVVAAAQAWGEAGAAGAAIVIPADSASARMAYARLQPPPARICERVNGDSYFFVLPFPSGDAAS